MSEWQDISTAPKDGTWIVAYIPEPLEDHLPAPFVTTVRWESARTKYWQQASETRQELITEDVSHWTGHETPTYWAPLLPHTTKADSDGDDGS